MYIFGGGFDGREWIGNSGLAGNDMMERVGRMKLDFGMFGVWLDEEVGMVRERIWWRIWDYFDFLIKECIYVGLYVFLWVVIFIFG